MYISLVEGIYLLLIVHLLYSSLLNTLIVPSLQMLSYFTFLVKVTKKALCDGIVMLLLVLFLRIKINLPFYHIFLLILKIFSQHSK